MPGLILRPRFYGLIIGLACLAAGCAALRTGFNIPPDEMHHEDAICYFETAWLAPPPNSDGLLYTLNGWNRVYTGEIAYPLLGKAAALARPLVRAAESLFPQAAVEPLGPERLFLPAITVATRCQPGVRVYRLLNVAILGVTLAWLFASGRRHPQSAVLGLTLVALPQALYLYSYANSDALALSFSLVTLAFVLGRRDLLTNWRPAVVLAVLTALVLMSKESFWFGLIPPYALVTRLALQEWRSGEPGSRRRLVSRMLVLGALVALLTLPRTWPWITQPDYGARLTAMMEARAARTYRPSVLAAPLYRLRDQGVPFLWVVTRLDWYRASLESAYGVFGHFTLPAPRWAFLAAGLLFAAQAAATVMAARGRWTRLDPEARLLLCVAPLMIALNVAGSLYNSWTYDYQPQGRYLLASLPALAAVLGGTIDVDGPPARRARAAGWVIVFGLAVYCLAFVAPWAPK